jgi:hypothetical protein
MLRNSPFRQWSISVACAIGCVTAATRSQAQYSIPIANPAQSRTSFVALPGMTAPGIPSADNNAGAMSYPQTSMPGTGLPAQTSMPDTGLSTQSIDPSLSTGIPQSTATGTEQPLYFEEAWSWQLIPDGLLYKSYLAGTREPRFASQWVHVRDVGWYWDLTVGGRAGILRYGTTDPVWPEGIQVDVEGAAFPRVNLDENRDLDSVDFRFGVPLTVRQGPWQGKIGYYHYSAHLGDEYMVRNASLSRINYSRDCLVLGVGLYLNPNLRLYTEADYAYYTDGGTEPWEFQFGAEYSPIEPALRWGAPFLAVNGRLREEVDYGGSVTAEAGWQWRGQSGRLIRLGAFYFNGLSDQGEFFNRFEEQVGAGLWYDF